jgi:hypothetical protein
MAISTFRTLPTVVIGFERNIMVYKRAHAPQGDLVPAPNIPGQ